MRLKIWRPELGHSDAFLVPRLWGIIEMNGDGRVYSQVEGAAPELVDQMKLFWETR